MKTKRINLVLPTLLLALLHNTLIAVVGVSADKF